MITSNKGFELKVASDTDFVHDVAFNYFGTRLAFCTSRQKISIWDKGRVPAGAQEWQETGVIEQAHSGPIWRLDWGHPEFGTGVLVSCGEDRAVCIWSEKPYVPTGNKWKRRAQLLDATKAVVDVQFAPKHHGLKLAAGSLDGVVRIYEAPDVLNMGDWAMEDFCITKGEGVQSLCWSPDIATEYIACVGTDSKLYLYGKPGGARRWQPLHCEAHHAEPGAAKDIRFSPNLCRPYDLLVTCGKGAKLWRFDTGPERTKLTLLRTLSDSTDIIWRASWNISGTMLTLSPESGKIQVWTSNQGKWESVYHIEHLEDAVSIKALPSR